MTSTLKKGITTLGIVGALGAGSVQVIDTQIDPFVNKGTHQELPLNSEQGDRLEITKDKPDITLKFWNDEESVKIIPQGNFSKAKRSLFSKKIEFKGNKVDAFIQPKSDDEFDIDFTLSSKPETNIFTYKIEGAEDLDFFYQPELTPEDIANGDIRPENVIGSYAVYHKTKINHVLGETNYGTGKAFHIYRPKAIDANGKEVWAELNYENGVLSVKVPQDFLDKAKYPVVVDPTFGRSATCTSSSSGDFMTGTMFPLTETGSVSQISVFRENGGNVASKTAIYKDSDDSFVVSSVEKTAGFLWNNFDITPAKKLTASDYYLMFWNHEAGGNWHRYDNTGTGQKSLADVNAYGSWPATIPAHTNQATRRYCIYATYTAETIDPLPFNGNKINFPYTDDNTGETLLIYSDKANYNLSRSDDIFFAIKNTTATNETVRIQIQSEKGEVFTDIHATSSIQLASSTEDIWEPIAKENIGDINGNKKAPPSFKPKIQAAYTINAGQTKYFKTNLKPVNTASGEFYIVAKGDNGAYGILDPHFTSGDKESVLTTYTSSGTYIASTSLAWVEAWGAGGGGSTNVGGGGGGAYARDEDVALTPGSSYTVTVGTSAVNTDGGDSSFESTVIAVGGDSGTNGSAGGTAAASTGDTKFSASNGGNGTGNQRGGAGAGDAGNASAGTGGTPNGAFAAANIQGRQIAGGGGSAAGAQQTGARGEVRIYEEMTPLENFPYVSSRSYNRRTTAGTSHTITMPSGSVAGDLLMIIFNADDDDDNNDDVIIETGNWTRLSKGAGGTQMVAAVFYKFAEGNDTATVTTIDSEVSAHLVLNIKNGGIPTAASSTGLSTNADPPNLNPAVTANYLWIASANTDTGNNTNKATLYTNPPGNYGNFLVEGGQNGWVSSAQRKTTASSENPGTFTTSSTNWVAFTIGIPFQAQAETSNSQIIN